MFILHLPSMQCYCNVDSNINGSSVHAMIMSETDITETSDMNLKTDSEGDLNA